MNRLLVEGAYVTFTANSQVYHYYIQDHLGNNRVVVDKYGTVEQVNHYYPYGGLMAESTGGNAQRYKYNGKEFDRMHGLDWYDYGARWMDPAIGRWHSVDPLCEKYYDVSPYVYCANNPVMFVDPDGKQIFLVGNHNVQMSLLKQLQSLTNDKLGMNRKTGEVTIMKTGIRNVEKNLPVGTSLISSLVNTGKQVDIQTNSENRFHEWEYDHQKEKSYNGEGADCTVSVDLNGNRDVMVKDNKTGEIHNEKIQLNIVLGHELVHAFRSTNGEASKDAKTEELTTTGLKGDYYYTENNLRKEQGLNMRVKY